ncbi:hypothetical protein AX17_000202 [Amanita inopinata Kibby_2008]|nr:hypothetical protein AX17_000202 [Amanita inopinata Kibby_2008]
MPPRRSSRSTRASVEPSQAEILPAKRKRGQTSKQTVEETESTVKPASKAKNASRRSASVSTSVPKTRTSSRGKTSLPDLVESEVEEDTDVLPAKKRSRPSREVQQVVKQESDSEEEEEEEVLEKKPAAASKRGKQSKQAADKPEAKSTRTRASNANGSAPVSNRSTRSSRRGRVEEPTREVEEEDEDEQEVQRLTLSNAAAKSRGRIVKKYDSGDDHDLDTAMGSKDEETKPNIRNGRKAASMIPSGKRRKPQKDTTEQSEEQPDPEVPASAEAVSANGIESEDHSSIANAKVSPKNTPMPEQPEEAEEEEEEEKSLFEPPPIPTPVSTAPAAPEEPPGPKTRLMIHKMALVNFKSYAGRQEIGPFHKSFSAIVGPNGSGKSNTIDALLFVFGYRASKMRQGKLSELIHNSDRYPDLDECSVEVHFREIIDLPGPDAFEVVPDSNLVVARQAFKSNASRYTINGRASNYTEVQTLLKGRGIDLDHKRFLILQGEVESIAQMKAKASTEHEDGLLEYLEDIIGTSKYKEPIEEALVEMERLQEERSIKMNRLRLVEKEKSALEEKKREAEDYLRLKNDHVRAQSRLWQWYIWQCLIAAEALEDRMQKFQKELEDETEKNRDDITHLEMLKKHYEGLEKAYAEVQAAATEALKDLASHEKKEINLQERKKHASSKAKKLKKTLQEDTAAKANAIRTTEESMQKIEKEKAKVDAHEASLAKEEQVLETIRDSLKDKTQVFHDQIEVKQRELQPWKAKINAKQAEIDVASSERDALAQKAETLKAQRQEALQALENLQVDQQAKVQEQESHKAKKASLQRELKQAESRLKHAQGQVQECRQKASSMRQRVDEAKVSQADSRSQNRVLDSLTRLRNAGRIQGFHGRLGSLGTIPDKYDVAASTACGSLNNMVVDTVEQGQACIEYLRSQNVGRASFIVLEKLTNTRGMEPIQTPENVPRLFDLIKPKDSRFAPAFYKGVGNTLVADNMDQATRIAYGQRRWRVVTLAGQLIDTSGTMSGGGSQPARGGMSSKLPSEAVPPEVLVQYEQESEDAARKLEDATKEARDAEAELDRLTRLGPELDLSFQKLGLEIETNKKRLLDAEKRVKELKSQSKPDAGDLARISKLDEEIAAVSEELEELQAKAGKVEQAIKDLEKKILEVGGSRLLTQKSKVDGIKLHISLANDEITKAEVAKAKAEKDAVKYEASIENNKPSLEEAMSELEELNSQLEELEQYVTELRTKVEAAQTAAEHEKEDLETLKAELDEKDEKIQEFRKREAEIKQNLSDTQKDHKENERILEHWRNEHDKLSLEEIDDDEEEEEAEKSTKDQAVEPKVKQEPDVEKSKAKCERTPSDELHIYSVEELSRFKKRDMVADTELLDEKVKKARPDLSVLKEYKRREEEFMNRAKDLEDVTQQRDAKKQQYDGLRKTRLDEFMAGFNLISLKLKEMYQMITLGGNAELELVDSMDPFSEGIIFSVMPPKKSWKNISNLSGGEKTLSSLALVFALHVFKPTPLYFMDEIDAALDFRNVSIVANYIKDRTKNAQFIIISLRNDMFELSHRLIGIYKTSNATRSICIDNHALTTPPSQVNVPAVA